MSLPPLLPRPDQPVKYIQLLGPTISTKLNFRFVRASLCLSGSFLSSGQPRGVSLLRPDGGKKAGMKARVPDSSFVLES